MNFADVFIDSLRYPFTNVKRLLTLMLLHFGTFLIIPIIMAYGYALRIIDHTLNGEKELPDFSNKGQLLEKGLEFIVINIIYKIPYFIIIGLMFTDYSMAIFSSNTVLNGYIFTAAIIIVEFVVNVFYVLGISNMVYEKRFQSALSFKKILGLIKKIGWGKYLAFILVFTIIVELLSSVAILSPLTPVQGIYAVILYYALTFIFSTYILAFSSRFEGLIYPLDEKEEENNNEIPV